MSLRPPRHGAPELGVRWPLIVMLFSIVIMAMTIVALSPFALRLFSGADGDWEQLSSISQTYGAVSALVAVVALLGIIATLVFQARQAQHAVQESRRQAMSELLQKAMDDPDLDECWGPIPEPSDPRTRKQQLYINMIVSQWCVAYESGAMPEHRLRAVAQEMFSALPGRVFWEEARKHRLSVMTEGRKGRFNQVLDEEFQVAPGSASTTPPAVNRRNLPSRSFTTGFFSGVLSGLALGVTAALSIVRFRRDRG